MRFTEFFQVVPSFMFMIPLVAIPPPSLGSIVAAISLVIWPPVPRSVRSEFMTLKTREFMEAARSLGLSHGAVIVRAPCGAGAWVSSSRTRSLSSFNPLERIGGQVAEMLRRHGLGGDPRAEASVYGETNRGGSAPLVPAAAKQRSIISELMQ